MFHNKHGSSRAALAHISHVLWWSGTSSKSHGSSPIISAHISCVLRWCRASQIQFVTAACKDQLLMFIYKTIPIWYCYADRSNIICSYIAQFPIFCLKKHLLWKIFFFFSRKSFSNLQETEFCYILGNVYSEP